MGSGFHAHIPPNQMSEVELDVRSSSQKTGFGMPGSPFLLPRTAGMRDRNQCLMHHCPVLAVSCAGRVLCWPCPVLAVVCPDNPRDTATGQGPMAFAAFTGAPRRKAHGVCQMLYRHGWSVTL